MHTGCFLGFEPGGDTGGPKFGTALIRVENERVLRQESGLARSVDEAILWVRERLDGVRPDGVGIDAPLFWETGRGGWRAADTALRAAYPETRASVMSPNGGQGSFVVQGPALVLRLRQAWPGLPVTETHPKVLHYALGKRKYDSLGWQVMAAGLFDRWSQPQGDAPLAEHAYDALLSAHAAAEWGLGRWSENLVRLSPDPLFPSGPVDYAWPEAMTGSPEKTKPGRKP